MYLVNLNWWVQLFLEIFFDEGYRSGLGFRIGLNDFGLQLGAQYRRSTTIHRGIDQY